MATERVFPLDGAAVEAFALKGTQSTHDTPSTANPNGLKVRRVTQIVRDFAKAPIDQLRVLDVACGEGVYSIELALRGAHVVGVDARTDRMVEGQAIAKRLRLANLEFQQADLRVVTPATHGIFDVILFLGILYHLDEKDIAPALRNLHAMCSQFVVIDSQISLEAFERRGSEAAYEGRTVREHGDQDPKAVRQARTFASIDNPLAFLLTRASLFRALKDAGFTSVCEVMVPLEPFKPVDRITVIATRGEPVRISTYPWVEGKTEEEIEAFLSRAIMQAGGRAAGSAGMTPLGLGKALVRGVLQKLGYELRRI